PERVAQRADQLPGPAHGRMIHRPRVTHLVVSHLSTVLGFVMALLLLATSAAQRRAPGTTFAWLLAVGLIPYGGVPLYLVFGGRKLRQRGGKAKLYNRPQPMAKLDS